MCSSDLIVIGWFVSRKALRNELDMTAGQFSLWRFVIRYIAPLAVFGILLLQLGIIGAN